MYGPSQWLPWIVGAVAYPAHVPARRARRFVLPLVAVLVVVAVAAAVLGVGLVRRSFPQASGELSLEGLSASVEVIRDERGIADIYADTPEDLFMAQGYVAAQDRFFQMDLRRHITAGRLSELVGEGGLETDKVIRTMGWRRVAEAELPRLSAETRRYLQSYAAGVNAYLADNPAPSQVALEYVVLQQSVPDYRIEPWTEVDSLAWLKAMAWDLKSNYADELARARLVGRLPLSQITSAYPPYPYDLNAPILSAEEWEPAAAPLDPDDDRGGTAPDAAPETGDGQPDTGQGRHFGATRPQLAGAAPAFELTAVDAVLAGTAASLEAVPQLVGRGEGIGSNSWVVSGDHTATGAPMLANDPHLSVTQPGVWLQTGLHCRELSDACPFDVSGFTFAGFPGVVIGHNTEIAWGFTNLAPDVTDFYLEEVDGDRYRRENSWLPLEERTEVITVPGQDDVTLTVRSTGHGPVMSDVLTDVAEAGSDAPVNGVETSNDYAVSMAWTGLEQTRTAESVFALNRATDWEDFRQAARLFAAPSQNMLYADRAGNIGYQAPGLIPLRQSSTNGAPPGYWPALGSMPSYDWTGWVPFSEMPSAFNPPDGVIVAANQAVSGASTPFLTSEWDKGYRSQRISDLLTEHLAQGPLTAADMNQIQNDTYSGFADTLVTYLLAVDIDTAFYADGQELLRSWDRTSPGDDSPQSSAAMYYNAVWAQVLEQTFDDELPADLYASGNSRWMTLVDNLLERPDDPWWDDKSTVGIRESRDEILRQALIDARLDLTKRIGKDPSDWQWGALHQLPMRHQVLGDDPVPDIVRGVFNEGPFPMPGGSSLVNANNWDAGSGSFWVTSAPSMRMVVDLADLDQSTWVNQTGSSGHPFHPHYGDQTQAWIEGRTYAWRSSRDAVAAAAVDRLILTPGP